MIGFCFDIGIYWMEELGEISTNVWDVLFLFVSYVAKLRKTDNIALELVQPLTSLLRCLTSPIVPWKNNGLGTRDVDLNSCSSVA